MRRGPSLRKGVTEAAPVFCCIFYFYFTNFFVLPFSPCNACPCQVFMTNSANVFLLEPCSEVPVLLKEQLDACKAVLGIFRRMIMELAMTRKTW